MVIVIPYCELLNATELFNLKWPLLCYIDFNLIKENSQFTLQGIEKSSHSQYVMNGHSCIPSYYKKFYYNERRWARLLSRQFMRPDIIWKVLWVVIVIYWIGIRTEQMWILGKASLEAIVVVQLCPFSVEEAIDPHCEADEPLGLSSTCSPPQVYLHMCTYILPIKMYTILSAFSFIRMGTQSCRRMAVREKDIQGS